MPQRIREIMTGSLISLDVGSPAVEAARAMKDNGVGDVLVTDGSDVVGMVTDRDLAVRVLAESRAPDTPLRDVCSGGLYVLGPDDGVDEAVDLVRAHAVRRIPIVDRGQPVGIVTIGDLAIERDQRSALADVSAAAPNA